MKFDYKISKFYAKKQRTKATNCYIKQPKLLARRVCNIAKISDFLSYGYYAYAFWQNIGLRMKVILEQIRAHKHRNYLI